MRLPLIIGVALFLSNCSQFSSSKAKEIVGSLEISVDGLMQQQQTTDLAFSTRYLSLHQQVMQEWEATKRDTAKIKDIINATEGHHYLQFQIKPNTAGKSLEALYNQQDSDQTWEETFMELNFQAKPQFELTYGQATLPCKLYHVFPGVNAQSGLQFMLVFQDPTAKINQQFQEDLTIQFEDKYFTEQRIAFTFSKADLNNIPTLNL